MPAEGALRDRLGADARLIETLGWLPGEGTVRAALHRARMERSARALGFRFDGAAFDAALAGIANGDAPLRLRLTLGAEGDFDAAAAPFSPLPAGTVWRVALARTRLASGDPLLAHKTTRRAVYDAARAEHPADAADEVLLLNERGEVCEGSFTNLFADLGDGVLATPPLACGLLPGILRGEMLASGRAAERMLRPADLGAATALFVGNSLRGLIAARLVGA